jgi:PAS domain-containing protein
MLDRLRALRWLAPPDLGERRTALAAATARAVGWLTIAFGLAWLTACALFLGLPPTRLAACLGAVAVGAGVVALAGRRQVRMAGLLAAVGTFALVTLGTTRAEHVLAPQNLSFFAVVTVAGLTLGGRAGVAAALACILVLMARWGGSQAQPAPPIDPIVAIAVQGTLLLVVALLLQIARVRNDAALSAAERHERAAERRNRELDRERERFRVMSESSQNLITELDLAGNVRYASPNHAEILGWTPEELVGQDWQKVIHSEAVIVDDHALGRAWAAPSPPPTARHDSSRSPAT